MFKEKIIFLDIDGVLNKHDIPSIYDEKALLVDSISILNRILASTFAQIVIISNWAQILTLEQIKQRLHEKGLLQNSIIDSIKVKELKIAGTLVESIEKDSFILEYIKENNVDRYVIIDDSLNSEKIDSTKLVKPITHIGITVEDAQKAIEILNYVSEN